MDTKNKLNFFLLKKKNHLNLDEKINKTLRPHELHLLK